MTKTPHPADTAGFFVGFTVFGNFALTLAFIGFGLATYAYLTLPLTLLIATAVVLGYTNRSVPVVGGEK